MSLKWFENPEVIKQHFENHADETTRRIGLYLANEVERLRGILKELENEANRTVAAPSTMKTHTISSTGIVASEEFITVDLSQCQGCGLYPYYCKCATGHQPTKVIFIPGRQ